LSEGIVAILVLVGAPIVLGALFWMIAVFEGGTRDDPGRTPFDPPPRRRPADSHQ
jgi:hypothetical protein